MPKHPLDKPHPLSRKRAEQKQAGRRKARLESRTSVPSGCALTLLALAVSLHLAVAQVRRRA